MKVFTEKSQQCFTDANLQQAALLPTFEVEIWLDHLMTVLDNRRSAEKAAANCHAKKCSSTPSTPPSESVQSKRLPEKVLDYYCGQCVEEETEETEIWVACDMCDLWYHCKCEELVNPPSSTELYICKKCQKIIIFVIKSRIINKCAFLKWFFFILVLILE